MNIVRPVVVSIEVAVEANISLNDKKEFLLDSNGSKNFSKVFLKKHKLHNLIKIKLYISTTTSTIIKRVIV